MDYKVLLLTLSIVVVVAGQTTQTSTISEQNRQDPTKVLVDSSTESTSKEEELKEDESTSTEEEGMGDLKTSGTAARYTFTQADARTSLSPAQANTIDLVAEDNDDDDDDDDDEDEAAETMEELEKILDGKASTMDDQKADVKTIVSATDDDDDDDDDDDGDDDDDDDNEDFVDPKTGSSKDSKLSQVRRLGDLPPGLPTGGSDSEGKTPEAPAPVFVPEPSDSSSDGSPQLSLTQGGYTRPDRRFFGIYDQRQRMRTGSASQQSETLETPSVPLPPQGIPPYQPQQSSRPMYQNPFGLPGGIQNGFFNTPPTGYNDFSSTNFQNPFYPADNGPYARDQNGFPVLQNFPRQQNQGFPTQGFQPNLPYQQQPNPVVDGSRPVQPFFHPGGFSGVPNMDIVDDTPRPNYNPFVRPQPAQQFPVNPNFYGSLPNADFSNAGVIPNLPINHNRQQFQPPVYRYPDNPLTPQSSDQVDKQKQDPTAEGSKDSDALTASQDKEDPTAVPFGARINAGPKEVYLRYPMQEAGYATEENLPVQNTTEKSRNSNPSNPPFPFFAQPDGFRPFSNPDPYRNALNALQQGYPLSMDDSNGTEEVIPADQFSSNIPPVQFDERLSRPPQMFNPYQRDQVFQNRQFLPMPGLDARNPFYQIPGAQDNSFLYPAPPTMRSAEDSRKTPSCAQENSTICFEDPDYPRRELIYALNSDSFFVERLSSPSQAVEELVLQDRKSLGDQESDNSICKSEIKYGLPLRMKSVKGPWKVIVNIDGNVGGNNKFIQPVRLEICQEANQPCSFTQVKTTCMQKYTLQRLIAFNPEKGLHSDVFRLPIACSCQVVEDAKA